MKEIKILTDALDVWSKQYKAYGDYSVTTLLDSPRIVQLTRRHKDEIVRPPEQQVSAFIGSCVHAGFEKSLRLQSLIDDRYDIERTVFDKIEDRLITGKFDILLNQRHLYDIKTCKTWKHVFDPQHREWTEQLNLYAYLLQRRGVEVRSINIIALYLDWVEREMLARPEYPRKPVEEYELTLWYYEDADLFIKDKIKTMKAAEEMPDEHLPLCTSDQMWERNIDGQFAVLKDDKAQRAARKFDTMVEAVAYAKEKGHAIVEKRLPVRTRCEKWCDVNKWCNQYAEYVNKRDASGKSVERVTV